MQSPKRRDLLRHLAFASVTMALPALALAPPGPATGVFQPLGARLQRFFAHTESARAIGRRYLASTPDQIDAVRLTAQICQTRENHLRLAYADANELRMFLAEQEKADFAEGRTVMLGGWIISQTEARLCALAALA